MEAQKPAVVEKEAGGEPCPCCVTSVQCTPHGFLYRKQDFQCGACWAQKRGICKLRMPGAMYR